ncbi:DEAD/DEAH box helicase [Roseomonas sp. M0104]|uniref:DEAD-box ATP-dependent RNA helicase RhpA n=1 Tax=Teichococcus coralli TaxID=2545983 RepID=A0A845B4Z3_9PROT|nr:DEAD/DEAH box helicase [Pseudoroseomonas coralli]MXP62261.1 DEAD/DEAH box helicase [Pseudoroseomonas coralli]
MSDQPDATAPSVAETEHYDDLNTSAGAAPAVDIARPDESAAPAPPRATFEDLGLSEPLLRGVVEVGYIHPTPIQEQAIPVVLMGRDVLGCAQTGTGKTASFVLPMMDILAGSRAKARMPRSLILEPTRELALQVAENFAKYGQHMKLNYALLIGGESMSDQTDALNQGVDVLIATPGRLLDLFERGRVMLADCKVLVIDEADRMLDMGFIPDVERIVSLLPPLRQTLFFSATMAAEIRKLADAFLQNPKEITVSAPASVATTITAGVALVQPHDKREALRRLIRSEDVQNALIFCNRKRDVDVLYKSLTKHGFQAGALHGDLAQSVRFATLEKFKAGELRLLVCSDVAARGIDIGGLSHVFNFDVPFRDEDYVHRIGRTGRAGREGRAFTIATADDVKLVSAIESLTGKPIPRIEIPGLDPVTAEELAEAASAPRGRGRGRPAAKGREREERPRREARGGERGPSRVREERPARPEAEARPAELRPAEEVRPPRREDRRRDRREDRQERREDRRDDLGPPVRGFGDAIPAFMLIPIPRPQREAATAVPAAAPEDPADSAAA